MPEIAVQIIARVLGRSYRRPRLPKNSASGNEKMMSNPTRVLRGLPQLGCSTMTKTKANAAAMSDAAANLPYRIVRILYALGRYSSSPILLR